MSDFRSELLHWAGSAGADCKSISHLLDCFCHFLNDRGFGIRRCNLATQTVHPLMANSRHVWFDRACDPGPINPAVVVARNRHNLGEAMIDEVFFNEWSDTNPQYLASPFYYVEQQGELHAAIAPAGEAQRFPVFNDLAELGCTDYYGKLLKSFAGMRQKLGLSTDRPGGFGKEGFEQLREAVGVVTLLLNTIVEQDTKDTLARVYVGQDPGQRVCAGMIHPGQVVSIDAAIWFSDLRDFTATSEGLEPEALIERLNAYFEIVAAAIYEGGGEILKYIGDAVLAVFPVSEGRDRSAACRSAVVALRDVEQRLSGINAASAARLEPAYAHGVGLHVGTTSYGNIGGRERLDFTVIGRAVNIASRIEGQCRPAGVSALCSVEFAKLAGAPSRSLGAFDLKGVAGQVELHAIDLAEAR